MRLIFRAALTHAIAGFRGGSYVRHAHSVFGRAPTMWCVQRKPNEQSEDVPYVHDESSVVRQLLADSPLRRLADMPGKEKVTVFIIV